MLVAVRKIPEMVTPAAPPGEPFLYRFTVEQYHRMIETGILTENDRVELLEGRIAPKMTHNPPHDVAVSLVKTGIEAMLPPAWMLRIQSAITTGDSEPEPDVAVVRSPARRYIASHPRSGDIALLVEIADTTLVGDRVDKARLYARARIPIYWIVNLIEDQIEVYTQPKGGKTPAYRQRRDYGKEETVPLMVAGKEIGRLAVRDLLP